MGYERTEYTVTERGSVELCAIIFEPETGVAPRPFQLTVSTDDGTAGNIAKHWSSIPLLKLFFVALNETST